MATNIVQLTPEYFPNSSKGRPLASADIYVGKVDLDPEIVANQKTLSVQQEDGSVVAVTQPISTSAGGVPEYLGSPVTLLVEGNYSLKVLDSSGSQIFYVPSVAADQALQPGNFFYPDYTNTDQGTTGNGNSVDDILTEVGATTKATLYFAHNSGSTETTYAFSTSSTITENYTCVFEPGALLSVATSKIVTINGPVKAGAWQIFTGAGRVDFPDSREILSSWFTSLSEAVRHIDNSEVTLKVTAAETLSANLTVPTTTTYSPIRGAIITDDASDATLTINGPVVAGLYQIFNWGAGSGDVTFGSTHTPIVHPHWFGAVVDGATDDQAAWQAAFDSFPTRGGRLQAPVGESDVGSTIVWPNNGSTCYPIDLVGHDVGNQGSSPGNVSQITYTTASGNLFDMRNGDASTLDWPGSIRNIFLQGQWTSGGGNTSKGIVMWKAKYSTIEHISINKFSTGLRIGDDASSLGSTIYASFNHITIANADTCFDATKCLFNQSILNGLRLTDCDGIGFYHTGGGGNVTITNSWVEGCGSYGMQFGNVVSVGISGSYFEGNTTAHVYVVNTNNDASHTSVTLLNNNFSNDDDKYSLKIDDVGNVNIIGNEFATANGFAVQVVGMSPSGCIIGNTGPRDGSPIFPSDKMARMITGDSVNPNVGHATTFPDTIHNHIEGSFYFSDSTTKDVLGWLVTESGVGGSFGAIPATTVTTDGSTATITALSQDSGLYRGMSIEIAGETFGSPATDYATILYLNPVANTAVLDKVTITGVSGAALTKHAVVKQEIRGVPLPGGRRMDVDVVTSGTGEDDLRSVTLPANYLFTPDGFWTGGIRIFAAGTKTGGNGNKELKLHFGSDSIVFNADANDTNDWQLEAVITARSASGAQNRTIRGFNGTTIINDVDLPTEDGTAAIVVKITGECSHADDVITQTMWNVKSF